MDKDCFFKDIVKDAEERFATSNQELDRFLQKLQKRKKKEIIGLMKDETLDLEQKLIDT